MVQIYLGLFRQVTPERISFVPACQRGSAYLDGARFVLNSLDDEDEQIRALLHELIHLAPPFAAYTQKFKTGAALRNESLELGIEQAAQNTYQTRPKIVMFLRKQLRVAKTLPRRDNDYEVEPCFC